MQFTEPHRIIPAIKQGPAKLNIILTIEKKVKIQSQNHCIQLRHVVLTVQKDIVSFLCQQ